MEHWVERCGWLVATVALLLGCSSEPRMKNPDSSASLEPDDAAHRYLEEVEGEAALAQVRSWNQSSLAVLEGHPRFKAFYEAALEISTSKERIRYGTIRSEYVYNFWQDEDHERGLWRRARFETYASGQPEWETLLDLDQLARTENANWVYKGVSCLPPEYVDCLVSLSDGGKDAVRIREFSIRGGGANVGFVTGGFDIPEAKTTAVWEDRDTLLLATDWGAETLTTSGYPFVVKRLKRGQSLDDATEVFRGTKEDVVVVPAPMENAEGHRWMIAVRGETFFTSSQHVLGDDGTTLQFPTPKKSTPHGLYGDQLMLTLEEDWQPAGQALFRQGDLLALTWSELLAGNPSPRTELIFRPSARQAVQGVSITREEVLVGLADNVAVKVMAWSNKTGSWQSRALPLPSSGTSSVAFASQREEKALVSFESFLSPDSLYLWNAVQDTGSMRLLQQLPAWFDASAHVVEQHEVASTDGVKVPYFVVRRKDLRFDGENPTLMYGYGGFQLSQMPHYSGAIGKLWLDQGGVYVLANIRGGGEFGPAWHQAGLKVRRQIIYDDFIAVAEDLISRRITSPRRLGAMGGSNGGLLMGVMYTQRPDLFAAIVCQVPLLDMLRFHTLLAGASWMDEYGNPDVPEEAAFLRKISPYHNVDPARSYPEIYFETSTKDDRVHPGHARKMAKRLEDLGKPFLYYENIDGGHAAGANQRETARRMALEFTYLTRALMGGT
ncbi:MAG: S9 family peptidase [Gammaproteobacteria bacterium]|nr:S9 family peptidase [Gammaproteobacteria bacterium]